MAPTCGQKWTREARRRGGAEKCFWQCLPVPAGTNRARSETLRFSDVLHQAVSACRKLESSRKEQRAKLPSLHGGAIVRRVKRRRMAAISEIPQVWEWICEVGISGVCSRSVKKKDEGTFADRKIKSMHASFSYNLDWAYCFLH
eukprot:3658231-Rhodomonas_salina.2